MGGEGAVSLGFGSCPTAMSTHATKISNVNDDPMHLMIPLGQIWREASVVTRLRDAGWCFFQCGAESDIASMEHLHDKAQYYTFTPWPKRAFQTVMERVMYTPGRYDGIDVDALAGDRASIVTHSLSSRDRRVASSRDPFLLFLDRLEGLPDGFDGIPCVT